ncbi:MAG: BatA domain-containing protein, partial [Candidatus Eisenbacteria bacterium]
PMNSIFFLHKLFLLGLSAAAVPLLIHLFTRKKARRLEFSTVTFIRDVAQREARRLRVRNRLLMILRMAAISLFVLAMARPVLVGPMFKGQGTTALVVVLDNSASMGCAKEGKTLMERGRELASEIFGALTDRDEGMLITVCNPPGAGTLISGPARLKSMANTVALTNATERPEKAIDMATALLGRSRSINKELYVVSDFQKGQWENRDVLRADVKGLRTFLVPLLAAPAENLSVGKAELIPSASGQFILDVSIANHGTASAKGVPVRVESGPSPSVSRGRGRVQAGGSQTGFAPSGQEAVPSQRVQYVDSRTVQYVDVEPGSATDVTFQLPDVRDLLGGGERATYAEPGASAELRIVLSEDALGADNTRFVVLNPPRELPILIVGEEERSVDVDFLSLVLKPARSAPGTFRSSFRPERIRIEDLTSDRLRRARCLILDNVGRLSRREIDALAEFKNSGGRILIALGDRVDIRHYSEDVLPALIQARLAGVEGREGSAKVGSGPGGESPTRSASQVSGEGDGFFWLKATIPAHPVLRSFNVKRGEPVCGARFYRVVRAEALEGSTVIAEFAEGLPALVEGQGVLLFASAMDPAWNDLVLNSAFLPLMHEVLAYLCGGSVLAGRSFRPGEVIEEELAGVRNAPLSMVGPAGEKMHISVTDLGAGQLVRTRPLSDVGVYRLYAGGEEVSSFSVNLDPLESRLLPVDRRSLSRSFRGARVVAAEQVSEVALASRSGRELWPIFAVLCLGLMVAEVFVARATSLPE